MSIQEKTKELLAIRQIIDEQSQELLALKSKKDGLNAEILQELTASGFNSIKTDFATVSKVVKKTWTITDKEKLTEGLKEKGLTDYISEMPNELFYLHKNELLKQGVELAGTETKESEYLSIRNNVKKITND